MTEKSTRWSFTAYEGQWGLFHKITAPIAEWGWQTEICPETGRKHYQGFIRTQSQVRHKALRDLLPGVHVEVAKDWNKLLNYCKKVDTRAPDSVPVHELAKNRHMTMADALTALVAYRPTKQEVEDYEQANNGQFWKYKDRYWHAVNAYLKDTKNYESIGLFTNNQMVVGWTKTFSVWIDRQTDIDRACMEQAKVLQGETEEPPAESGTL